jgi:histone H3/H4
MPKEDILIVASRLKDFIKDQSEMNSSADVLEVLSDHVRLLALEAIEAAREDGRRTVKARDFRRPGH